MAVDQEDVETAVHGKLTEPLIREKEKEKKSRTEEEEGSSKEGNPWMIYLSTFVAVCGSFEFGTCVSV